MDTARGDPMGIDRAMFMTKAEGLSRRERIEALERRKG